MKTELGGDNTAFISSSALLPARDVPFSANLTTAQQADLVAYLKTL
jgi:hypothetical protein